MTCRAPTNTVTCAGTSTGAVLTYDNERRLATWQKTPSAPTSTAAYWYDGEGNRVAQTLNGVTTYYVGSDHFTVVYTESGWLSASTTRNANQKSAPLPRALRSPTLPWCCSMIVRLMCSPNPRPAPAPVSACVSRTR